MNKEQIIEMARAAGMRATIGRTQDGKYHPDKNAIASSVPVEWLEAFAQLAADHALEEAAKRFGKEPAAAAIGEQP